MVRGKHAGHKVISPKFETERKVVKPSEEIELNR